MTAAIAPSARLDLADLEAMRGRVEAWLRYQSCTEAEDVAAAAIAQAALKIQRGDPVTEGFVWQAARSRQIDWGRRQATHPRLVSDDDLPDPAAPPDEYELGAADAQRLLRGMTPLQRVVLALWTEGYSLAETAQKLDLSVDAVKKLRQRAQASGQRAQATLDRGGRIKRQRPVSIRSAAERQAQSERSREAWASGKFANRAPMRHPRRWTESEDAVLRRESGHLTIPELAAAVALVGLQRTENAIKIRTVRLGLSSAYGGAMTARQVGALFGTDAKVVTHSWVRRGWLSGARMGDLPGCGWIFRDAHLDAFIRAHGHAFDWRAMRPGTWRALAETLDKGDPWLTIEQVAEVLGAKVPTLIQHCARGWLRSERRYEKSGAQAGRLMLRRSWLADFRYRRPDLVGNTRKPRAVAS